jgi:uncharacterized protein with HEPN domain
MSHDPKVCLYDAISACNLILEFSKEITLQEYKINLLVKSAIERQFEILGEALNRIKKIRPEILNEVSDWNRIISFRNIIVHGYDAIDDEIVFIVIKSKIPLLVGELLKIKD